MVRRLFVPLLLSVATLTSATDQITIKSEKTGHNYKLHVLLPAGYEKSTKDYPVVYALDAHDSFKPLSNYYKELREGEEISEAIIVAIGYVKGSWKEVLQRRWRDMTPTFDATVDSSYEKRYEVELRSGGAPQFLQSLKEEIFPKIEQSYRTADRHFIGYSFGGLFGTYVLFNEPSVFDSYVLGSPSYWWDEGVAFDLERKYAGSHDDLETRVFISAGSKEPDGIKANMPRMVSALESRGFKGLRLRSHLFKDKDHGTAIPVTLRRGLLELFSKDKR